jgi:predicted RNase H-like nuclease (RuvC/YqgF family)
MSLVGNDTFDQSYDESHEEIVTLKHQREELRETVSNLTKNHNYEMKQAAERVRALEEKLQSLKSINDKLTNRNTQNDADQAVYSESGNFNTGATKQKLPVYNTGGKLQKFSIVTPNTNLFE